MVAERLFEATSGLGFTYVTINMHDSLFGFTKILFDVDTTFDGNIDIFADLFVPGSQAQYSTSMSVDASGANKFAVKSDGGAVIRALSFEVNGGPPGRRFTSVEFTNTRQVRIGIADAPRPRNHNLNQVPERGTLSLLGVAALFSGFDAYRRRRTDT